MERDVILSQEEIDALMADLPDEEPASTENPVRVITDTSKTSYDAAHTAPAPERSGDSPITYDEVIAIAGSAAEAESAPVHASISRIYQRIGELEASLARVAELEAEVARLKRGA